MKLKDKVKLRIDDYLEFDSNILFIDNLVRIFGGSVRDSISGDEIHDIDILCGPLSAINLENKLISMGWSLIPEMYKASFSFMYSDIHIISEPKTLIKDCM